MPPEYIARRQSEDDSRPKSSLTNDNQPSNRVQSGSPLSFSKMHCITAFYLIQLYYKIARKNISCYTGTMPKIIDHEKRRKQIAEATWRTILERGMEGATVRNIAQEAGLSLGALRHYFTTQDELLGYAMTLVKEKRPPELTKLP